MTVNRDEMYVITIGTGEVYLDCPEEGCLRQGPIPLGFTPTVARINELATEHAHFHRLTSPTGGT